MKITKYSLQTQKQNIDVTLAVVADLHTKKVAPVIDALEKIKPDLILSPGDMFECFEERNDAINENGFDFFEIIPKTRVKTAISALDRYQKGQKTGI